jgi:[ribosomal protein S5]-alanine N-acetyltransferase
LSVAPIEFPVEGITDGEIRLRLLAEADLEALIEAVQDPEVPRWTRIPSPYGESEARAWLDHEERLRAGGEGLGTLIVEAATDRLLGGIGLVHIDWEEARCELGYWLTAEARGRAMMTRAVRLLAEWTFESLPIERITILAAVENDRSRAVAERAGFTFEGVLRSYIIFKDGRHDVATYSLLRGELD